MLHQWGLIVAWECATANVADNTLQWLIRQFEERMMVLSDTTSHAAEGDPTTRKLCQRGEWQDRIRTTAVELHRLLDTIQEASVQGRAVAIAENRLGWCFDRGDGNSSRF